MKPYFVTLSVSVVVMAESKLEAMLEAESNVSKICRDNGLEPDEVVEITSLEKLSHLSSEWDGQCFPYNCDKNLRLVDILPESEPFKDTKTIDMFEATK